MSSGRAKTILFWTTTILGPTSFVIGGIFGLTQSEEVIKATQHLGYPAYFGLLLGFWKLAGAIAITVPGLPRVKEWAYAGFAFDLTAASISHAAVGDPTSEVIAPFVFLALVVASWALRPASRKLAAPAARESALRGSFVASGQPALETA
jgi:DoxX-like protein